MARSPFLQSLLKYPPAKVLSAGKYLLPIPQTWRRRILEGIKAKLKSLNTQKVSRPSLEASLRDRLVSEFKPEIQQLEQLIDRDLSTWYLGVEG